MTAILTILRVTGILLAAAVFTALCFLVLPVMQSIRKPPDDMVQLGDVDTAELPPPPPPIEEEEPPEEEPEEPEPELEEEIQTLDLSQLELALNPGVGEGFGGAELGNLLKVAGAGGDDVDALFSLADLDQAPRVIYQPAPVRSAKVRKKSPGTVKVIFIVNERGRVEKPMVQSSSDPVFERPALAAVKQWKFEPGKRNGKAVSTRMRIPITFPKN